jgi:hypothetical protein
MGTSSGFPADWLAANNGSLPAAPGCPSAAGGQANDPVMLTIQVRAPTNAYSFSVSMYFFSAEYPEWICTPYNDFFVTLVDSTANNPADKNIAVYNDGNVLWPVGVNILQAAPGLFTQCHNGPITYVTGPSWGTCTAPQSSYDGCLGTNELTDTGFHGSSSAYCGNRYRGGGTSWLTMSGNVTPGELTTLRFAIWDTGDDIYDSVVLLDDFQWNVTASTPGVTPQ